MTNEPQDNPERDYLVRLTSAFGPLREIMPVAVAEDWLRKARVGTRIVYYEGFILQDIETLEDAHYKHLRRLARLFMDAAECGRVELSQKRLGDGHYRYMARKIATTRAAKRRS